MYDNSNEYYKRKHKRGWKFLLKFTDLFLCYSRTPCFGKISNSIRRSIARKISKGISRYATIEKGSYISEGLEVEDYGCVGEYCSTAWGVHIGKHVMIGPNVHFYTVNHKRAEDMRTFKGYTDPKPIYIGEYSWIGYGAIILAGVTIGKGVTVAAGSVVCSNIPDYCLAAGNPAVIKKHYIQDE